MRPSTITLWANAALQEINVQDGLQLRTLIIILHYIKNAIMQTNQILNKMQTQTKKHTCSVCKGTGKQTVSMDTLNFDYKLRKWVTTPDPHPTKMACIGCGGTGRLTDEEKGLVDYERKMWCTCGAKHGSNYFKDNQHPEISKHHYRCRDCGKVTQIG